MTWDLSIQLWQMAITWDGVEAIPSAGNGQRWSMLPSANTGQSGQTMRDDGNWMRIHIISFANNCSFEAGKHFFLNRRQKQWELMNTGEKPPHHHLMACYHFPRGGIFRLDQSNTTDAMGGNWRNGLCWIKHTHAKGDVLISQNLLCTSR